mgnify:FL=1|jgi:hypothetical protein
MSNLDQHLDANKLATLEATASTMALSLAMSRHPLHSPFEAYDSAYEEFMDANPDDDWPEDYLAWQPFENYTLGDMQDLLENFKDSLMVFANQVLVDCEVIKDE